MTAPPRIPVLDLAPEIAEIRAELDAAWSRVLASGHFILGPEVEAFEREMAAYLGVRHAVGVASGTDALVLALRAAGVGPGDEVIVPTFTFFATAESVSVLGATPVLVDVEPGGFGLDPEQVARAVGPLTRAIVPVHLFGLAADLDPVLALATERGIAVVEDVAQALGGTLAGRKLGTLGRAGAFSFFPSKNLGGFGDGGLVATDDDEVAASVRMLRAHGSRRKYFNEAIGYNSRLDALQAAILRAKLPRLDAWNEGRRAAAARYGALLAGVPGLALPEGRPGAVPVHHQYTVRVTGGRRDGLREALAARGIETMVYYPRCMHELPVYARPGLAFPRAEAASREVLSLPIWPRIDGSVQERVAAAVRAALA